MQNKSQFNLRAERHRYGRLVSQHELARALGGQYDRAILIAIERRIVLINPTEEEYLRCTIQALAAQPSPVRPVGRPRKMATERWQKGDI